MSSVVGSHKIDVSYGDAPIAGSPFKCEVVDPKKVAVILPPTPLVLRQEAALRGSIHILHQKYMRRNRDYVMFNLRHRLQYLAGVKKLHTQCFHSYGSIKI